MTPRDWLLLPMKRWEVCVGKVTFFIEAKEMLVLNNTPLVVAFRDGELHDGNPNSGFKRIFHAVDSVRRLDGNDMLRDTEERSL